MHIFCHEAEYIMGIYTLRCRSGQGPIKMMYGTARRTDNIDIKNIKISHSTGQVVLCKPWE